MAIETDPNKLKVIPDTYWEKIRNWLFQHLFPEDYSNLAEEKFTKGFGEGYVAGRKHQYEHDKKISKELWNVEI